MHQVYGLGTLSQATYEVLEEDGRTGVVLHVKEKSQGPNYLEAGLSASSDLNGRSDFNVRVGILRSPGPVPRAPSDIPDTASSRRRGRVRLESSLRS